MEEIGEFVQGECMEMCPSNEIKMRIRENLVHPFEMCPDMSGPDKTRMVKEFSRSAAGKTLQNPKNLRPPNVLITTINYLLDDVISMDNVSFIKIYDFLLDRLRAVRQDLIVQNTSIAHTICILQPIVKFHAYASYRLCVEDIRDYDPHINKTHLQECLKRLLCTYDECDRLYSVKEQIHGFLIKYRPQFEALYILLNMGDKTAISRGISLPKHFRNNLVNKSLSTSLNYLKGNFVRASRTILKLPTLFAAVASLHLPELRRKSYKIMSVAYSCKNLTFPVETVKDWLLYNNVEEVLDDCKFYGIHVQNNKISFLKNDFKDRTEPLILRHQTFVDEQLEDISLPSLILYD